MAREGYFPNLTSSRDVRAAVTSAEHRVTKVWADYYKEKYIDTKTDSPQIEEEFIRKYGWTIQEDHFRKILENYRNQKDSPDSTP